MRNIIPCLLQAIENVTPLVILLTLAQTLLWTRVQTKFCTWNLLRYTAFFFFLTMHMQCVNFFLFVYISKSFEMPQQCVVPWAGKKYLYCELKSRTAGTLADFFSEEAPPWLELGAGVDDRYFVCHIPWKILRRGGGGGPGLVWHSLAMPLANGNPHGQAHAWERTPMEDDVVAQTVVKVTVAREVSFSIDWSAHVWFKKKSFVEPAGRTRRSDWPQQRPE